MTPYELQQLWLANRANLFQSGYVPSDLIKFGGPHQFGGKYFAPEYQDVSGYPAKDMGNFHPFDVEWGIRGSPSTMSHQLWKAANGIGYPKLPSTLQGDDRDFALGRLLSQHLLGQMGPGNVTTISPFRFAPPQLR